MRSIRRTRLRTLVVAVLLLAGTRMAAAQALPRPPADPRVARMVAAVSETRLRTLVERLAAFGTRHTLSDTTSTTRGIGAARQFIYDELARSSPRLQVAFATFRVAPQGRITRDVELRNVVALLPGRSARRIYVTAHYDTVSTGANGAHGPNTRPPGQPAPPDPQLDATQDYNVDAPGANDNASGTALTMELARVLAAADCAVRRHAGVRAVGRRRAGPDRLARAGARAWPSTRSSSTRPSTATSSATRAAATVERCAERTRLRRRTGRLDVARAGPLRAAGGGHLRADAPRAPHGARGPLRSRQRSLGVQPTPTTRRWSFAKPARTSPASTSPLDTVDGVDIRLPGAEHPRQRGRRRHARARPSGARRDRRRRRTIPAHHRPAAIGLRRQPALGRGAGRGVVSHLLARRPGRRTGSAASPSATSRHTSCAACRSTTTCSALRRSTRKATRA